MCIVLSVVDEAENVVRKDIAFSVSPKGLFDILSQVQLSKMTIRLGES